MREDCLAIVDDVFRHRVKQHYGVDIEWFEFPHILRYREGGNYRPHSDADKWNPQTKSWDRTMDRDYSAIIYLNSEFSGGTIAFPHLNLRIQPRTGMLVIFPSDHRFVHTAEPTLSGTRYALVTWSAKQGGERVMNRLPNKTVRLDASN
jgi:predicted 2-oxoglutarate/Fe(II)-dependent dioxygenase YbiX